MISMPRLGHTYLQRNRKRFPFIREATPSRFPMSTRDAAMALRRFGLGARPGELKRIADDPRGFLLQGLAAPVSARINDPGLEPSHVTFAAAMEAQRLTRLARAAVNDASAATKDGASAPGAPGSASADPPAPRPDMQAEPRPGAAPPKAEPGLPKAAQIRRQTFQLEAAARFAQAMRTDAPFVERLVMFWSNHFCVSANKGMVGGIAGAYEREAIRPHVLGRFADMLLAVEKHPAMLIYLDNQISVGPNSRAGLNRGLGLNENLAREILELHTLGVGGGYTQADVTNLARIITGWTVGNIGNVASEPGKFFFAPPRHEPGEWTVLGKRYRDGGQQTGEQVLADLARHPSTARHIATKLARHFVGDEPPPALVQRLERSFRETGGDLAALAKTLVETPETWAPPPTKVLPPYDFLIAMARGFAIEAAPLEVLRLTNMLGQPLWRPPAPAGWPDADGAWAAPSAVRERLRIAELAVRRIGALVDPRAAGDDLFGDALSGPTRQAVARAETREQGLELLIMSPDFQRR
jgi:uncharacterized protein (DUF1800 family)